MILNELTSVIFGLADRIMLRWLTGSLHEVGVYTIGYGLAMAVGMVFGATLNQTLTPTALRECAAHGNEAVRALKRRMLDIWIVVVMIVVALLLCTGREFLELLAGGRKGCSGPVFVIMAVTLLWYSFLDIAQYGLLLQRSATRYLLIMRSTVVLPGALLLWSDASVRQGVRRMPQQRRDRAATA